MRKHRFLLMGPKKPFSTKIPYFAVFTQFAVYCILVEAFMHNKLQLLLRNYCYFDFAIVRKTANYWGKGNDFLGTCIYQTCSLLHNTCISDGMTGPYYATNHRYHQIPSPKSLSQMFPVNYNYAMRYF
jgi:hypothetical protein